MVLRGCRVAVASNRCPIQALIRAAYAGTSGRSWEFTSSAGWDCLCLFSLIRSSIQMLISNPTIRRIKENTWPSLTWLKRLFFFLVTNNDVLLLVEVSVVWLHLSIEYATPTPGCCRDGGQLFYFQDLLPTLWAALVLGKHCWCVRSDEALAHHSWEEFGKYSRQRWPERRSQE